MSGCLAPASLYLMHEQHGSMTHHRRIHGSHHSSIAHEWIGLQGCLTMPIDPVLIRCKRSNRLLTMGCRAAERVVRGQQLVRVLCALLDARPQQALRAAVSRPPGGTEAVAEVRLADADAIAVRQTALAALWWRLQAAACPLSRSHFLTNMVLAVMKPGCMRSTSD